MSEPVEIDKKDEQPPSPPPVPPAADPELGWFAEAKEFVKAVAWAVAIAVFLRSFVVEAYKIPSGSMLPTLQVGDHIFVNKFIYGFQIPLTTHKLMMWKNPHRGEVIVFKFPEDVSKDYIKRVIGEPGDRIVVRGEDLFVNDTLQTAEFTKEIDVVDQGCYPQPARLYEEKLDTGVTHAKVHLEGRGPALPGTWTVPAGMLFVMGDNRDNSADSRTGFFVPMSYVKGRAMFVWLSWNSCGTWSPTDLIRFDRVGEVVR